MNHLLGTIYGLIFVTALLSGCAGPGRTLDKLVESGEHGAADDLYRAERSYFLKGKARDEAGLGRYAMSLETALAELTAEDERTLGAVTEQLHDPTRWPAIRRSLDRARPARRLAAHPLYEDFPSAFSELKRTIELFETAEAALLAGAPEQFRRFDHSEGNFDQEYPRVGRVHDRGRLLFMAAAADAFPFENYTPLELKRLRTKYGGLVTTAERATLKGSVYRRHLAHLVGRERRYSWIEHRRAAEAAEGFHAAGEKLPAHLVAAYRASSPRVPVSLTTAEDPSRPMTLLEALKYQRSAEDPILVVLVTGLDTDESVVSRQQVASRFKHGVTHAPNPRHVTLAKRVARLEVELGESEAGVESSSSNAREVLGMAGRGNTTVDRLAGLSALLSGAGAVLENSIAKRQRGELERLRRELASVPATVESDAYRPYEYTRTAVSIERTLGLQLIVGDRLSGTVDVYRTRLPERRSFTIGTGLHPDDKAAASLVAPDELLAALSTPMVIDAAALLAVLTADDAEPVIRGHSYELLEELLR